MFVLFRAVTYASIFIGFILIYLPAQLLSWSGIIRPALFEIQQIVGIVIGTSGLVIANWCVFTFAFFGRGTPAPFDPHRRLVIRGPYRFVRNPMYLGAGFALLGSALFYESLQILGYTVLFLLASHIFVVMYAEPALLRTFGQNYEIYCDQAKRWFPSLKSTPDSNAA